MIRIRLLAPLPKILGLTEAYNSIVLELPVKPDTNLQILFSQLSNQYPAFGSLSDSNLSNELRGIIVIVNGTLVPESEYHQTLLGDSAEVSLLLPYTGG